MCSSETDRSEILSPTPRRHYLLQQQSSQWLSSAISPPVSRPSSPLNPNSTRHRRHKSSLSFSSLAEQHVKIRRDGKVDGVNASATRRWVRWMHKHGFQNWVLPVEILAAIWVKWAVGLGSYSGTYLSFFLYFYHYWMNPLMLSVLCRPRYPSNVRRL
jgi:alpha-1,3-glucosyltransferase